jgi:translocation and assembly module TamB
MKLVRVGLWLVGLVAVLALALALTLRWASRSESVLRWGVAKLGERLPCNLTVEGLTGSLSEPVRIQRLVCESDTLRVEASSVALDWSPWALTQERLDIDRLQAEVLSVESRGKREGQPTPPDSLALPLAVHLGRLEVGTLTVRGVGNEIALREIDASYDGDSRSHHLVLRRLASDWGTAAGELRLGAQAPLPLSARLRIDSAAVEGWPVAVEAALSGELRRIQARAAGSVGTLPVQADVTLAPFEPDPLPEVAVRTQGLDLRRLFPSAPQTAISAQIEGAARGFDSLSGTLTAVNAQDGTLDAQRLPARTLASHITLTRDRIVLQDAQVSLGTAGAAAGSAGIARDGITVDLTTSRLDLRGVHSALRTTHLAGTARLRVEAGRQLIQTDLRQDDMRVQADAVIAEQRLALERLIAQAAGASLRATGEMRLVDDLAFSVEGELQRFDPARFGDFPAARISGTLAAQGRLRPDWVAALRYRLGTSQFRGQALAGNGRLTLSARRVRDADARLTLGGNTLALRGSFGATGDVLDFSLDAPHLAALRKDLAGRLRASGKLSGTPARPAVDASAEGSRLGFGEYRVQRWTATARVEQADDPRLHLDSRFEQPARGDTVLDAIAVTAAGTLARHTVALTATGTGVDLRAGAQGGYDPKQRLWSGTLLSLANSGEFAFDLSQSAQLQVGEKRLILGRTAITFAGGQLALEETRFTDGELVSSGSMTGMPLARLLHLARQTPRLQSTLVLGGRWALRARDLVEGTVEIAREAGDVVIASEEQPLALGLSELKLAVRATGSTLSAQAAVRSARFEADASGETALSRRNGKWGLAGGAPLKLRGRASSSSIRPVVALLSSTVTGDGRLTLRLEGDGTIADPNLRGELQGDELRIEQVESGVFLREGVLRASFANRAMQLDTFTIRGGGGRFSATGRVGLPAGKLALDLDWAAEKLTAVQHPDLRLVATGKGKVTMQDGRSSLRGALTADQGRVELRSNTAPALGQDVVVAGREQRTAVTARSLRPEVDLKLDLGQDFLIRGRGLDAKLVGSVRLIGAGDAPLEAQGEISVARGTYEAYGQRLEIDKGVLYFSGPVDNPGLEIRALRKNMEVEAGVEVTGTARNPRVRLVSNPDVPDAEKLSWLVLGRRVEGAGTSDAERLQAAAMALAAGLGTAPLQRQLARAVGLDEIRIAPSSSSSGEQGGMLAVGKRISDRIYVTYEQSLTTATNIFRVSYQLTRNWSVRTESGTTDAVDIFYTLSFD